MEIILNVMNQAKVFTHRALHITEHNHIIRETWETDQEDDLLFKRNYKIWCTCGYNWKGNK